MIGKLTRVLGLLALSATSAWAEPAMTTRQARAMADDPVRDALMRQLGGEMELVRPECRPLQSCDLSGYQLQTKPYSTHIVDLCRTDLLRFEFEPTEVGVGDDQPLRARGLSSEPRYFFTKDPEGEFYQARQDPSGPRTAACRKPADGQPRFTAASEYDALNGYRAFLRLLAWAPGAPAGDCAVRVFQGSTSCGDRLKALRKADLTAVRGCFGSPSDSCELDLGRMTVSVVQRNTGAGVRIVNVTLADWPPLID